MQAMDSMNMIEEAIKSKGASISEESKNKMILDMELKVREA